MKRRILTVLLSVFMLGSLSVGFTACNGQAGKDGANGINGSDGTDGVDGVGVKTAYIDEYGNLILVLTDGTEINCGNAAPENTESLFYTEIKEDGEVTGYTVRGIGNVSALDLVIPATYRGKPVVSIYEGAFAGCDWLTSVTIPDSVESIGEYAFYECSALEYVSAGSGLATVGKFAFGRCSAIEEVYISDAGAWCEVEFENLSANPLYFAHDLYLGNSLLTQIVIPDSVTRIGDYAFYEVDNLESVVIGDGVKSIGDYAFFGCVNLQSAEAGAAVGSIGEAAFSECGKLETVHLGGSVESIGEYAFSDCYAIEEIVMPSAMKSIGGCAFINCTALKSVSFNEGLESIEGGAFAGCTALESFIMPDSVNYIGYGVVMFEVGGGFVEIGVMYNALTEIRISNSLTVLPDFAFAHTNIKSIEIGSNVQTVSYSAFYGCEFLERVIIPVSVTKITSYAFYKCPNLKEVFYAGTAEQWAGVTVGKNGNDELTGENVTVYYYSETQPSEDGSFWHYVNGELTVW